LEELLKPKSSTLIPLPHNLIDRIWTERPSRPQNEIFSLSFEYAGKSSKEKITQLREHLESKKASATVVSMLDEVCWLFNLRGSDIAYNPGTSPFLFNT
jgi:Xaa-Pro aminopeptidase